MRRSLVLAALVAAGGARGVASAGGARLVVESASVDFRDAQGGAGGHILIEGRFTGLQLDPNRPVGLAVGGSMRWVRLEQSGGTGQRFSASSDEYSLSLDMDRRRFVATESDVLSNRRNRVAVKLQQGGSAACVKLEFTEAGDRWTFDEQRNRQLPCD